MTENEMVGWHHQLNGHEFEQTLGDSEGKGSLVCCSLWGHRVRHDLATEKQIHMEHNVNPERAKTCCTKQSAVLQCSRMVFINDGF